MTADPDNEPQTASSDDVPQASDSGASLLQNVLTVLLMLLCLGVSSLAGLMIGTGAASSPELTTCTYGRSMTTWRCSSS